MKPIRKVKAWDEKFERKKPILLNPHCCMTIEIFKRTDDLLNMFLCDWKYDKKDYAKEAAKELVRHLRGQECDAFLEALGNECMRAYHSRRLEVYSDPLKKKVKL